MNRISSATWRFICLVLILAALPPLSVGAADAPAVPSGKSGTAWHELIHIPGPNPVLVHGEPGQWDDGVIEAADAIKDNGRYYFYYHGTGKKGYQLGVAVASAPLGPFEKHGNQPILELGPPGSWDDTGVACGMVLKEGEGNYRMWYSGRDARKKGSCWSIGLATAPHPLGPWTKDRRNPILTDFGYVGGVIKREGTYYLYCAYPIGSTGPDYSPMALTTAKAPEGPWTRYSGNPVLREGAKGQWDDGGFSEAEVLLADGRFHMFYGGAKLDPVRIRTRESIGYAWSTDGYRFEKSPQNPVAPREAVPNAAAFAEVHAIHEPPFVYLYHTLRYLEPRRAEDQKRFPTIEDLGIQVLVTSRPFRLEMPVLFRSRLAPKAATSFEEGTILSRAAASRVTLFVRFSETPGMIFPHLRSEISEDGIHWTMGGISPELRQVETGRPFEKRIQINGKPKFLRVRVSNASADLPLENLRVTALLEG